MPVSGKNLPADILINGTLAFIVLIWIIPIIGLLVSSFRDRFEIQTSGWWTILPHKEMKMVEEFPIPEGLDRNGVMEIRGATGTFEEFRQGITNPEGQFLVWVGNRRLGIIQVQDEVWTMNTKFTLDNYKEVLGGQEYEFKNPDGTTFTIKGNNLTRAFLNSLAITIPAVADPDLDCCFCCLWFRLDALPRAKGHVYQRDCLAGGTLADRPGAHPARLCQAEPERDLPGRLAGTHRLWPGTRHLPAVWLYLHLAREILESAFIDGASHFTIFIKLVLPLSIPALASFAIFQFLWVWNDYLVALIFIGAKPDVQVLTMRIAELVGSRGNDWHLLTAAAFIAMALPLLVFIALQRYFVRGMMAGSVKG